MPFDDKRQRYHDLKVWPEFFRDLGSTRKNFEVRFNDRNFQSGDRIHLREWDRTAKPNSSHEPTGNYTGGELFARIGYVLPLDSCPGLIGEKTGYVVLGLEFDME